jgi:hypothetical protein
MSRRYFSNPVFVEESLSDKTEIGSFEVKTSSSNLALPVLVKIVFSRLETLILVEEGVAG